MEIMRLVNTYLSNRELSVQEIKAVCDLFKEHYDEKIEVSRYKYEDRNYYETDFDLVEVNFCKERIHTSIQTLITIHEQAITLIDQPIEIIVANDDTDTEIQLFEEDCNNVSSFGLFVTKRSIPKLVPYYTSDICRAYLNFKHVSFGVMFE